MAHVMMNWGGIKFAQTTRSYDELKRSTAYDWATVGRMGSGRRPAKQFVGPGEDRVTLTGVVFGLFSPGGGSAVIGTKQLDELHAEAAKGSPRLLQDGRGVVYGKFVLTNIEEGQSVIMDTGAPRKQSYTLTFERYGDD